MAPGIIWDDANKVRLLLLVIDKSDLRMGVDIWKAVAEGMGPGTSASAVSQKFYKLKKESEHIAHNANDASGASSAPTTPKTPRGRKRKDKNDGDGDGENGTPKKKRSATEKKTQTVKTKSTADDSEPRIKTDVDSEEGGIADGIEEHDEE